jgi:hypothetical protein
MTRTEPAVAVVTPASRLNKVLLPLPLGPLMNRRSPGATVNASIASTVGCSGCQRN